MLAYGALEWTFVVILVVLVGAAGLFGLFLLAQLFRDHGGGRTVRRSRR
jgi:hypothetical protein